MKSHKKKVYNNFQNIKKSCLFTYIQDYKIHHIFIKRQSCWQKLPVC